METPKVRFFGNIYKFKKIFDNGRMLFQCQEPNCVAKIKVEDAYVMRITGRHTHRPAFLEREYYIVGPPIDKRRRKKKEKAQKTCREESLKTEDAKMASD